MSKTILLTGSTDGIGRHAAEMLAQQGHRVLLHGRNSQKLERLAHELGGLDTFEADLSSLADVDALADAIRERHDSLDVLINNAGVFAVSEPLTGDGLDVRFVVNTIAPYRLTQKLLPLFPNTGRVVNVSSAAQAPVNIDALLGHKTGLPDMEAYAQSKLAVTAWSGWMARARGNAGPAFISLNPGSMLGTKMVKSAFGVDGADIRIGADILVRAALSDEFEDATGKYFDNDARRFAPPPGAASDPGRAKAIVDAIEATLQKFAPHSA